MGKPAARLGDSTSHGSPLLGSPCQTVLIGGQPAWRMGDQHTCPIPNAPPPAGPGTPHGPGNTTVIPDSASMVLVGGKAAARVGDIVNEPGAVVPLPPPNPIVAGCPTVLIATMPGGGSGSGADADAACAGDPVIVFDGTVFDLAADFELENFVPLAIARSYRSSKSLVEGEFGWGWTHNLSCSLKIADGECTITEGFEEKRIPAPDENGPQFDEAQSCAAFPLDRGYMVYLKDVSRLCRFDVPGSSGVFLVSRIEDLYGNGRNFSYDGDLRLSAVSDRAGRRLIFEYEGHRIHAVYVGAPAAATRLIKQYRYDARADLVEVLDASGSTVRFQYDDHLLVSKTLANGYQVFWQYDAERRCTATWTSDGRYSYRFEFLPDFQTLLTAANGRRELIQFDENGKLIGSVDQIGPVPHIPKAEPIRVDGRVTMLVDGEGRVMKPEYDEAGRVTALKTASGVMWRKVYHPKGSEKTVTSPEGRSVEYVYDERGRQTRVESPDGSWEEWTWDEADNVTRIKLSSGVERRFGHDAFGNITAHYGPGGKATTYVLDELMRVAEERRPDGSWLKWRFNPLGSAAEIESSSGYRTIFERNGAGQIVRAATFAPEGALAAECSFDIDQVGEDAFVRSLDGRLAMRRDLRSRIVELIRADGSQIICEYDDDDLLRRVDRPTGVTQIEYDDSGQVSAVSEPDGERIVVERDPEGRLQALQEEKSGRQIAVTRDREGNLIGDNTGRGNVAYPLTAAHKLAAIRVDDEEFAQFEWDGAGLSAIRTFGRTVLLRTDLTRLRSEIEFPGGVVERRTFSPSGKLLTEIAVSPDGRPFLDYSYHYDQAGRLVSVQNGGTTQFRYDEAGHLTNFDSRHASESYTYDRAGTLTGTSLHGTYTVDSKGRIIQAGKEFLAYDDAGRLTERVGPDGKLTYRFDHQDRLTQVTLANGEVITYGYDLIGRRTEKRTAQEVVRFTWAGSLMVRESHFDQAGELLRSEIRYTYLGDLPLPVLRRDIGYEAGEVVSDRVYSYHLDRLGVPRAVTDEAGRIVWRSEFDAWRGSRDVRGEIEQPFRFAGHYFEAETGLHFTTGRYYDPSLGQFLTPSLHDEIAGLGARVYCYGDPVNYVDPTGNDPVAGGVMWIQGKLMSAFESAVQTGASQGLQGSQLGKFVDGEMSKSIEGINQDLQQMGSRNRVIDQAQRFEEFDKATPAEGWGRGSPPYPPSKIADAIIVEMACNFKGASPTYKDGQKGFIKKVRRGYDWSVGQPENLANDQAQYAKLFTEGSNARFQMWDATKGSVATLLKGAGVI